ncbi:MAG: glycosyl hydrolase [Novosphingobium sp.]|uniref:glycoside hydrolase family 30 protein n=1 Tax=Novosphingobium sp. TaxID=1874826 RepID=UPI00260C5198|nr:glycoside hydrolase family 30 beta sandwich domain-containing protein [Novosphingobium sp.]MCP5387355.1 glycosyl hydrolase [Novosphingobium sp.]
MSISLSRSGALAALALGCMLAACGARYGSGVPDKAVERVRVYVSSVDARRKLEEMPTLPLENARTGAEDRSAETIAIDPAAAQQEVVGFGAAMTDASAGLFEQVLQPGERAELYVELFGDKGLALGFVRVPIGASDFSSRHYSLDDVPSGQSDPQLTRFSMAEPQRAQIIALKAAKRINPGLVLMASPWSAPGWMKDTGSAIKGQLRPEYYAAYAAYFGRYLDAMEAQRLPVRYVSVQNEPRFEPADYPGMRFPAEARARFLADHLGPLLAARRAPVGVLEWDHNWDHPEEPLAVLADPRAARYVTGVAWHCYAGDPAAMEQVRAAHPDKEVFFTECSGGNWEPDWGKTLGWMVDSLLIAPSRAGSRGTILWNLALDENHGPHLGGCGDCRGVVTIDRKTRKITRNVEYYVLGHASRFVRAGARRIASNEDSSLANVAFVNPDGSRVLIAHNRDTTSASVVVRDGDRAFRITLPPGEVATFVWPGSAVSPG